MPPVARAKNRVWWRQSVRLLSHAALCPRHACCIAALSMCVCVICVCFGEFAQLVPVASASFLVFFPCTHTTQGYKFCYLDLKSDQLEESCGLLNTVVCLLPSSRPSAIPRPSSPRPSYNVEAGKHPATAGCCRCRVRRRRSQRQCHVPSKGEKESRLCCKWAALHWMWIGHRAVGGVEGFLKIVLGGHAPHESCCLEHPSRSAWHCAHLPVRRVRSDLNTYWRNGSSARSWNALDGRQAERPDCSRVRRSRASDAHLVLEPFP
jgi:hypothetical protein